MKYTFLIFYLFIVISCNTDYYNHQYSFDDNIWYYDDPVSFEFNIKDTLSVFDLILEVDHTDQYPYQNLYVKTLTTLPNDSISLQNLSLELANQGGFWLGTCQGSNCQIEIPIQSSIHFDQIGIHQLDVEQYTRRDTLLGLKGLGLRLVKLQ